MMRWMLVFCSLFVIHLMGGLSLTPPDPDLFWHVRLPRATLALIAGAALGLAGLLLQTLFRYPLVEPGLIGVTAGAALGAVTALALTGSMLWVPPLAALGAVSLLATVLLLARRLRLPGEGLLLVGIALSALAMGLMQLLLVVQGEATLRAAQFWLIGSFDLMDPEWLAPLGLCVLIAALWAFRQADALDVWRLGEEPAAALGVSVRGLTRWLLWIAALLVGGVVSLAGSVAFIGLMAPHLVPEHWQRSHRTQVPAVLLAGATLAVVADLLAQRLLSPLELPVGVMTSVLGGLFFLMLLRQQRRTC